MTKYSIKDQIMDALHDHIKCSGDELSDIVDDVLRAIEKGFIERKQEISDKHKLAQELIDSILKEIKCDLCHDDVLRAIEKDFIERKQEISDKHKLAQELIDSILKEIKCDLCHLRFDCSVVYDPEECALEVNEGK